MTLANVLVWLQPRRAFASAIARRLCGTAFRFAAFLGSCTQQTIRKLVARLVAVDVGHDHFDRACFVKSPQQTFQSDTLHASRAGLESSQRTSGFLSLISSQPLPHLAAIWFLQERTHKDIQNVFSIVPFLAGGLAGLPRNLGNDLILAASPPDMRSALTT